MSKPKTHATLPEVSQEHNEPRRSKTISVQYTPSANRISRHSQQDKSIIVPGCSEMCISPFQSVEVACTHWHCKTCNSSKNTVTFVGCQAVTKQHIQTMQKVSIALLKTMAPWRPVMQMQDRIQEILLIFITDFQLSCATTLRHSLL